jgi:hypothetical protein
MSSSTVTALGPNDPWAIINAVNVGTMIPKNFSICCCVQTLAVRRTAGILGSVFGSLPTL